MNTIESDKSFTGSLPESYQRYLVPLIFEPYAADVAQRVVPRSPERLLEIAAGTGVVTRALADALPKDTSIVATDLNQPMLDRAGAVGTSRPVEWRRADALSLPFDDESFDVVVCQFGVMFFPDKVKAYSEARRVLKPGGVYLFNVWDRIEENEFADTVTRAVGAMFPANPPRFLPRTPYGYYDAEAIVGELMRAGFTAPPAIATVAARSRAASPRFPAIGYCHGTPLRNEIEAANASSLDQATEAATAAIAAQFGPAIVDARIQAHVITVER